MPQYQAAQIAADMQATGADDEPVQHDRGSLLTADREFGCNRIISFRRVIGKYEQRTTPFGSAQLNECIRGSIYGRGLAEAATTGNLHHA